MKLIVILDGVTFQHAAELLFDVGVSANERRTAKRIYTRCLEDTISAILFADKIGIPDRLPPVGIVYPGQFLRGQLSRVLPDVLHPIARVERDGGLEAFVRTDATIREAVQQDINVLDDAYMQGRAYWNELVFREVFGYLLNDPQLDISKRHPEI